MLSCLLLELLVITAVAAGCKSDLDCSLNGVCGGGTCLCDSPWDGAACSQLLFKSTPLSGKSLYNSSDPRNTWNGPILSGPDGQFHLYVPLYEEGSLSVVTTTLHGIASSVTGPWDWTARPNLPLTAINPAALVFPGEGGQLVYSLWLGGEVLLSQSPDGPFTAIHNFSYPGGNPAPVYHHGEFFMTNQATEQLWTTPALAPGGIWVVFANISHASLPADQYHVEDPFLWVDKRDNWHIVNHAYSNLQFTACGSSVASAHFFSPDGLSWNWSAQPYSHTVQYDDGSSHTFVTLERPNLHFDESGSLTHINLAVDLVTGNEGCENRTNHTHNGHCPCDNCKVSGYYSSSTGRSSMESICSPFCSGMTMLERQLLCCNSMWPKITKAVCKTTTATAGPVWLAHIIIQHNDGKHDWRTRELRGGVLGGGSG